MDYILPEWVAAVLHTYGLGDEWMGFDMFELADRVPPAAGKRKTVPTTAKPGGRMANPRGRRKKPPLLNGNVG
jgi:hypothetical protein